MARSNIPEHTQTQLFYVSMRICALCFGLKNDSGEKRGQIAHLNKDNTQTNLDDLVWLCLDHHDQYDSTTRQTKNYRPSEVRLYRSRLYDFVKIRRAQSSQDNEDSARDVVSSVLTDVFRFMPFTHLLTYIHDFPEVFSQRILMPLDAWNIFKRSNPHIYPFSDQGLNSKLDEFFSISSMLHNHIRSYVADVPAYISIVDYNGTDHRLALNRALDSSHMNQVLSTAARIATQYEQAYLALVSYIRQAYPNTNINSYRE